MKWRTHSEIGEHILAEVEGWRRLRRSFATITSAGTDKVIRMGLRGEDIPLISRIISVADAYNAMTSNRPYRDAMRSRVARSLAQGVESQFDTAVVAAFEAILAMAEEDYGSPSREDFTLVEQDEYLSRVSDPIRALLLGAA